MTEQKSAVEVLRECYTQLPVLRAVMQAIPVVGASIDTLVEGRLGQIQLNRIEDFARVLSLRLNKIERSAADLDSEGFADLVQNTFARVVRTRSQDKRSRFANILARQVTIGAPWDEADSAISLLEQLEDLHINVLHAALEAPPLGERLHVISLDKPKHGETLLVTHAFPGHSAAALRMVVADLLSRGLLHDDGIGSWDVVAMQILVPTNLAEWFAKWITEEQ